jgi:hypothetical protein
MAIVSRKSAAVVLNMEAAAIRYMVDALKLVARDPAVTLPDALVITSGNDSTHGANSRHYRDEAIDVRSKSFPSRASKLAFVKRLEAALGDRFRVLFENDGTENEHFHVQVRKGQRF